MAKRLLMGNEAFAHAALEAGVGFVAGYPGTPSSELVETVARLHAAGSAHGVHVEWSTNEKAALELAAAASISGTRALFTCKQMGMNVAADALLSLNYLGIQGGLVLFVADDPGPISSQTEQDTRRFAAFAKVPVLDPATPEQGFAMMKAAFDLSERFNTPVIVRPTTRINHASTFFDIEDETFARPPRLVRDPAEIVSTSDQAAKDLKLEDGTSGFVRDPERWVIFPKRSYEAHKQINERLERIAHIFTYEETFARFNPLYKDGKQLELNISVETDPSEAATDIAYAPDGSTPRVLGIAAGGDSASYALEALGMLTKEAKRTGNPLPPYKFIQVGTPYPIPRRTITRFFKGISDVLVLEELDSVIEEELLKVAGTSFLSPQIHGRLTKEAPTRGENSTEKLVFCIAEFFDTYVKREQPHTYSYHDLANRLLGEDTLYAYDGTLPPRPPVLCAGCPHRGSFYAVKQALKSMGIPREKAIFCGDIGCYTLGNAEPLDAVDTCLCMGAGITMAQGFAATNPDKKSIAFVGDSTFFASAMTGIANAVYNNHDITICVLDNSTTAMTGMQPHPGTGKTLMGEQNPPISIGKVLQALGVKFIAYANPLRRESAEATMEKALAFEGPSAVIFESPCVQTFRSDKLAHVNVAKCTGCKRCVLEIGCPAISFNPHMRGAKSGRRGQAVIDISQCNGCGLCPQVCPFGAIKIFGRQEFQAKTEAEMMVIMSTKADEGLSVDIATDAEPSGTYMDATYTVFSDNAPGEGVAGNGGVAGRSDGAGSDGEDTVGSASASDSASAAGSEDASSADANGADQGASTVSGNDDQDASADANAADTSANNAIPADDTNIDTFENTDAEADTDVFDTDVEDDAIFSGDVYELERAYDEAPHEMYGGILHINLEESGLR